MKLGSLKASRTKDQRVQQVAASVKCLEEKAAESAESERKSNQKRLEGIKAGTDISSADEGNNHSEELGWQAKSRKLCRKSLKTTTVNQPLPCFRARQSSRRAGSRHTVALPRHAIAKRACRKGPMQCAFRQGLQLLGSEAAVREDAHEDPRPEATDNVYNTWPGF